jgi:hypothetical protein
VAISRRALLLAASCGLAKADAPEYDRLELDPRTGVAIASKWVDPVLPGSLVKPFTALAYERTHGQFPTVTCNGCWGGRAHGTLRLPQAIAVSCNRYFAELSMRVDPAQMRFVCAEYNLPEAPADVEARLGLGRAWRIAPADLLLAYTQVIRHPAIREGMRLCATQGTARVLRKGLAKTGTSPCEHRKRMPGDGLAVWLWPEDQPRRAVLVREHGVPGAVAAKRILA